MVYDNRAESGPVGENGNSGGGPQDPEAAAAAATLEEAVPQRRRGSGAWRNKGRRVLGGEGSRSVIEGNIMSLPDGRQFIRDGPWWVDKSVVDDYESRGIDLLNDPNPTPDMIQAVEGNRMEFARGLNLARRLGVKDYNDQHYAPGSGGDDDPTKYGYSSWQQMRNQAVKNAQAQGITDENVLHWLWITNPANLAQSGYLNNRPNTPPTSTPAPSTDRQPPANPTPNAEKIVNGILYKQQPDGTWLKVGPAPTPGQPAPATDPAQPTQTTRPPLVQPSLSRLGNTMNRVPGMRPADWWKGGGTGGGAADTMPQLGGGAMKPMQMPKAPAAPSLTMPKPTFGGIKLK